MIGRCLFIVGMGLSFAGVLSGQVKANYFHHLRLNDGLSQGTNYFIYKDSRGFVWLSSISGLNRYDGHEVKVYKPVLNDTSSLFGLNVQSSFFEAKDHNLWFSTWEGLNCYVRKHDNFRHFTIRQEDGSSMLGYYVFHLDVHGNLWILVGNTEVYVFNIQTEEFTFKHTLEVDALRATPVVDGKGEVRRVYYLGFLTEGLWIADYSGGVNTGLFSRFTEEDSTPLFISKAIVKGDSCWMATNQGLVLYLPKTGQFRIFQIQDDIRPRVYSSLTPVGKNQLLVAVKGAGLNVFDLEKMQFVGRYLVAPTDPNSITSNDIEEVDTDSGGNVWIATNNAGVDFFHPLKKKFNVIRPRRPDSFSSERVEIKTMVRASKNKVWCGTFGKGVAIYDEDGRTFTWKNYVSTKERGKGLGNVIKMFKDQKDRIWILTWSGVFLGWPAYDWIQALPELTQVYLDGCQLKNGKIVLASYDGYLYEVGESEKNITAVAIREITDPDPFVSLWQDSRGYLFGCHFLKDIWVIDPQNNYRLVQKIPIVGDSFSFCELDGDSSIWIANSYGLVRLTRHNGHYVHSVLNEKDDGMSAGIYSVTAGNDGKLWMGTGNGVTSYDPRSNVFQNFGLADGVSALFFNGFASMKDKDGQIWLGSADGITTFYPKKLNLLVNKTSPVITKILVNDQEERHLVCTRTGATNISEIESLNLDYRQRTLSFTLAALEYSDPSKNRFRFKLSGVDPDWVDAGTNNFIRYALIPPGSHIFSVMATNSDGQWGNSREILINIDPPFTQTVLFYFLVGVAMLALLWGIVQYNLNKDLRKWQIEEEKRQALENERQRIARDVHDDLGSGISALSLLAEIAKYKRSETELRSELEKISQASGVLSGKIREVIWTVSAKNDTIENLISYMSRYAYELLDSSDIDFQVNFPDYIPETTISGQSRRTLFLAFKEALNNIIKHAGATQVRIDFSVDYGVLAISVTDNGKGFDPQLLVSSTGNGLLNMQARMREIGGDCQFKTNNQGTQVIFSKNLTKGKNHI